MASGALCNRFVFSVGDRGSSTWSVTLQTGLAAGSYCNIIGDSNADNAATCTGVVVSSSGLVSLQVPALSAVALHSNAKK